DAEIHHLHPLGRSGPIVMPATATARAGRIVWSPLRLGSVTDLAEALAHGISYDLGHIGLLRAQVANLRKAGEGRHGKSRIGDLADWLMTHPVITSGSVMKGLGLSRRGALDMIATLEAEGMLKQVTYRKTARIWATTSLADRLKRRTAYGTAPGAGLTEKKAATTEGQDTVQDVSGLGRQRHLREENKETVSAAMAAMDAAMAEADRLLAGIGQGRIDPED
ncbi:MAG: helix-turn-helix domain-containing protein, partial [Roseibium sp.]|uniref:helix-turn-helix domain-containing protein n=1 Tax=Roseibium sp. TaxID=1936156 RepID=UPI003298A21B